MSDILTKHQFQHYFLVKAYDVIGNGSYKKHLSKCKEIGDPWAIEMCQSVHQVQSLLKEITLTVHEMPITANRLNEICKDVMMSAQPPVKLHPGFTTCSITNRKCMKCLDLSKTHKNQNSLYVDARFCLFFMLLWFCHKLEYIVRSLTRTWIDSLPQDVSYQAMCDELPVVMSREIEQMYVLFMKSRSHIMETLSEYSKSRKMFLSVT